MCPVFLQEKKNQVNWKKEIAFLSLWSFVCTNKPMEWVSHFWLKRPCAWTVARELSDVQSSSEDRQLNKSKCYFIAVASWKILLWKDGFKCLSCPRLRGRDQTLAGSHLPSENVRLLKCSPPHSDRCDLLVCHFCGSWERNGHILFTGHWIK